jgi:colicin import membrane protein
MQMKTASIVSAGLHAAVLLWALISFGGKTFEVTPAESLPVDLISEKQLAEITKGAKDAPKLEKPKPFVEKMADPTTPPDETKPKIADKKPPVTTAQEKQAPPPPQAKPDPIADQIKKVEDKPPEKTEKQPPVPPKKPVAQQKSLDFDKIAALIDKREPTRAAVTGEQPQPNSAPSLGKASATAARLSGSEIGALRARISQCWNPPVGVDSAQDVMVVFRVLFNEDGTVKAGPDVVGGKLNPAGPVFAESAKRAILECQPYTMLHKETYNDWRDIELAFNLRDMFR